MNCSVCGSPLLFDRVVFRCGCGAYVHAYCTDKHIVSSHRPEMEEGYADLNGDFHLKYQPEPVAPASLAPASEPSVDEPDEGEMEEEVLVADPNIIADLEAEPGDAEEEEER